jgi:hypothetical protein
MFNVQFNNCVVLFNINGFILLSIKLIVFHVRSDKNSLISQTKNTNQRKIMCNDVGVCVLHRNKFDTVNSTAISILVLMSAAFDSSFKKIIIKCLSRSPFLQKIIAINFTKKKNSKCITKKNEAKT